MKREIMISILILYTAWCFVSCKNPLVIAILPDTYTVTFDKNGGDTGAKPNTKIVKPSTTTIDKLPEEPTRTGYVFKEWNKKADGSGSTFTAHTTVTDNITVYAQWKESSEFLGGSAVIKGIYKIGEELSIDTSNISGAVAPFRYQWRSGGINITGETNAIYTIRGIDVGKSISCVITHNTTAGSITATGQIIPYTIKFDITELTDNDSISFAEQNTIVETYGNADDTIAIYYTLTGGNITDWLILTFNNTPQKIINKPENSYIFYTVTAADAENGVIIIAVASLHTNLIVLDAPTDIGLTKNGVISFTAGANNAAAGSMSYTYTLYKDGTAVGVYTEQPIANNGTTVAGLVEEMLTGTGAYTVKVTTHTTNTAYTTSSIQSHSSNVINVYSVTITITGTSGMDKVTVNTTDHTTGFIEYVFGGDTVTLTATPDTGRHVAWSGDGAATGTTLTITDIDADAVVTVTFTDKAAQTITASTYNTTTPLIGEMIVSTDGTYTANDGGSAGTHIYHWKRSDNIDRTGNVTQLAENKNYTPTGTDFGKYIWLETTPVGSENFIGTAVRGDVLRVGVKLIVIVTGAGGGMTTVGGSNGSAGVIIYGQATIAVTKNISTDTVVWSASGNTGTFGSTTNASTNYTPPIAPSTGTITLTATLSAVAGTIDNPFLVATVEDLQHVGKPQAGTGYANWTRTAYYKQTANIDMNGQTFTAIGNNSQPFTGSFDGQGYTITNLTINGSGNLYQGLFGYIQSYIQSCEIKNIGLVGGSVTGGTYVGGVIGYNGSGTVTNCYTTGDVTGTSSVVGGVIGYNNSGTVTNCYATGNITGTTEVGGVVGNNPGTVTNCYATGNITGTYYIGGVVGDNSGTVQNCYATGSITGRENVGGIVGRSNSGTVQNNIALNASIRATTSNTYFIGRIVGQNISFTNNYAWERMTVEYFVSFMYMDKTLNKFPNSNDGADLLIINAKTQDAWTTAGFTFNATNWKWTDGKMPHLFDNDLWNWAHITDLGTESNPFLVATVEDLQNVGKPEAGTENFYRTLSAHYKQTANIDLTGTGNWTSIGNSNNNNIRFDGTFDGQGYTIIGLTINSNSNYLGLFSYIGTSGIVKNVGLVSGNISGRGWIGGIAGINQGTVLNCYNTGSVNGGISGWIGGLVGSNSGLIKNCYTTGNISGNSSFIGGVAGDNNYDGTIENCVALNGSIVSTDVVYDRIGRVVGDDNLNPIGPLINNYARESGMTITANNSPVSPTNNAAGKHGANAAAADYEGPNSETWWKNTVLFPDTAWNFAANALPTLKH